jgi:hypothetical protein
MSGTDFPGGKQMPDRFPKGKNPKAGPGAGSTQHADRTAGGAGSPPVKFPKSGAETKERVSPHSKEESSEMLQFGQPAREVGPAPTSRVYTRDYSKVGREPDDVDLLSGVIGNPLGL